MALNAQDTFLIVNFKNNQATQFLQLKVVSESQWLIFTDCQEVKRNAKDMRFPDLSFAGMTCGEKFRSSLKQPMEVETVSDYLKAFTSSKKDRPTSQSGFNSRNSRNAEERKNNKKAL